MTTDNIVKVTPEQLRDEPAQTREQYNFIINLAREANVRLTRDLAQARSELTAVDEALTNEGFARDALARECNQLETDREYNASLVMERDRTIAHVRRELKGLQGANRALARQLTSVKSNREFWYKRALRAERERDKWRGDWESVTAELLNAQTKLGLLQSAIDNLCEQNERQIDMEECGARCSYPSKFPEWKTAWEQAYELRYGASKAAVKLLERLATLDAAETALANCGLTGIYDDFNGPANAIKQMVERLVQLEGGQALQAERQLRQKAEQRAEQYAESLGEERDAVHEALDECQIERNYPDGTTMSARTRIFSLPQRTERAEALAQLVTPRLGELLERLAWCAEMGGYPVAAEHGREHAAKIREALDGSA